MEKKFTGLTKKEIDTTLENFENFYNDKDIKIESDFKKTIKILQHLLALQVREDSRYKENKRLQITALRYRLSQIVLLLLILVYLIIN